MSNIIQLSEFAANSISQNIDGGKNKPDVDMSNDAKELTDSQKLTPSGQTDKKIEIPEVEKLAETLNKTLDNGNQQLLFEIDRETHNQVIKVVDRQTGKIIRQYPGEELLSIRKALLEGIENGRVPKGLIVDTRS